MKRLHPRLHRVIFAIVLAASGTATTALCILVLQLPDRFQGFKPGDRLPRVRLVSPEGEPVDTDSWGGRPTLLMFLDPECPACLTELKNINTLAPTMPDLRVALLSSNPRDRRDAGITTYLDPTGVLTRRMRRLAVPVVYWVSSDGRILYARSGARSLTDDASAFYALLSNEGVDATAVRADGPDASRR